jgi:hypothetical protein
MIDVSTQSVESTRKGVVYMERKSLIMAVGIILISLSGCVSTLIVEKTAAVATTAKQDKFSFDLSTPGADIGILIVQCRPPSNQMLVDKYAMAIDSYAPLVVTKQSDTDIKLNAGEHSIKFYATSGKSGESEKVTFGKLTKKEVVIAKDKEQSLKYTGPYRLFGEGKVVEIY